MGTSHEVVYICKQKKKPFKSCAYRMPQKIITTHLTVMLLSNPWCQDTDPLVLPTDSTHKKENMNLMSTRTCVTCCCCWQIHNDITFPSAPGIAPSNIKKIAHCIAV